MRKIDISDIKKKLKENEIRLEEYEGRIKGMENNIDKEKLNVIKDIYEYSKKAHNSMLRLDDYITKLVEINASLDYIINKD